jgi:predicted nucleic acid-binding protein
MPADLGRQFLDTNVLVYAHDRSAGAKHDRAVELLAELADSQDGALSVQVLQELFVTLTGKLAGSVPPDEAAEIVADLSTMRTHAPIGSDVLAAIDIHRRLQVSYWDAMILRSAMALGCAVVWSEDLSHGRRYDDVEVRSPFA